MNLNPSFVGTLYNMPTNFAVSISSEIQFVFFDLEQKVISPQSNFKITSKIIGKNPPRNLFYKWSAYFSSISGGQSSVIASGENLVEIIIDPSTLAEYDFATYTCEIFAKSEHANDPSMTAISKDTERISVMHDLTSIRAELTNDNILIPCDDDFTNPVLDNAKTRMIIYQGMKDISNQFTFTYTVEGIDDPLKVTITQGTNADVNLFTLTAIDDTVKQFLLNIKAEYNDGNPNDENRMIFEKNCYFAKQGAAGVLSYVTTDPLIMTIGPDTTSYDVELTLKKNATSQPALIDTMVPTNCSATIIGDNPNDPVTIRISNFSGITGKVVIPVKEAVAPNLFVQNVTVSWSRPYLTKYYIKPLNGTAIKNKTGTVSLEARKLTGTTDEALTDNNIQLATQGESGYTLHGHSKVFAAADINSSLVVYLINTGTNSVYDTVTLADISDGHGFIGWVEAPEGLVIKKNKLGVITPSSLHLNPKFAMDGTIVGPGTTGFSFTATPTILTGQADADPTTKNVTISSTAFVNGGNTGYTAIWTAQMVKNGVTYSFTVAETIYVSFDGIDGNHAKLLQIKPSSPVLYCTQDKVVQEPESLEISAVLVNIPSNTPITWTVTSDIGAVAFTQNGTTITISSAAIQQAATSLTISASLTYESVTYTDSETLPKVLAGTDAIAANLSNDTVTIPLDSTGENWDHSGCTTEMKVYKGIVDDSANWTFSITDITEDSASGSASYTLSGNNYVISGAVTGQLISTGAGRGQLTISNSNQDLKSLSVTITASRTGYASLSKKFKVTKVPMGGFGLTLSSYSKVVGVDEKGGNPNPTEMTVMAYLKTGIYGVNKTLQISNVLGCTTEVLGSAGNHTGVRVTAYTTGANKSLNGGSFTIDAYYNNVYVASQDFIFSKVYKPVGAWSIQTVDTITFNCDPDGNVLDGSGNIIPAPENTQNLAITYAGSTPANDGTLYTLSLGTPSGCSSQLLPLTNPTQIRIYGIAQATKNGYAIINLAASDNPSVILATKRVNFIKSIKGQPSVDAKLSLDSVHVPTDKDGNNGNYAGALTTMSVFSGSVDDSANWTYASSLTSGTATFTRSNSNRTLTVTGMTTDVATFTITATKGTTTLSKVFTATKSKQGLTGNDGTAAKSLRLTASSQIFKALVDGTIQSPASITLSAFKENIAETLTWTSPVTLTGTETSKTLTSANFGSNTSVTIQVSVTSGSVTYSDSITIIKVQNGETGKDALAGFLTNENHTIATNAAGGGTLDYTGAGGQLKVFSGITDVTSSCTFSVVGGTAGSKTQNGLTITITSGGTYTLSGASWSTSIETFTLRATYNSVNIDKVYTISKAKQGVQGDPGINAKTVSLSASAQSFKFDATGTPLPPSQSINLTCNRQNISTAASWSTTPSVTLTGTGDTRTLTDVNFGSNASVKVTVTADGISDSITIVRVSDGEDGEDPVTGYLTNESHIVATDVNGSGGDLSLAGGSFKVFEGLTEKTTGITFSVVTVTTGITITIAADGTYTVTSLTSDNATAKLRAVYNGTTIDKIYTISKSKQGPQGLPGDDAKIVKLTSSAQAFSFNGLDQANPANQTITFTANRQNISTAITWTTTPTITLSGTGDTRTLTVANFGSNSSVKVRAEADGFYDEITIFRLKEGIQGIQGLTGQNAVAGFLTNESHTVATDVDGNGGVYTSAGGTFKVFDGLTDKTTNSTFSVVSFTTGLNITIGAATGIYTISGLTVDSAVATLRAVYGSVTIDKVYSITKSKQGETGPKGTEGSGIVPRGEWQPNTDYYYISEVRRDVVTVGGTTYYAKTNSNRAVFNSNDWGVMPSYEAIATDLLLADNAWVREMVLGTGGSIHSQNWSVNCANGFNLDSDTFQLRGGSIVGSSFKTSDQPTESRIEIIGNELTFYTYIPDVGASSCTFAPMDIEGSYVGVSGSLFFGSLWDNMTTLGLNQIVMDTQDSPGRGAPGVKMVLENSRLRFERYDPGTSIENKVDIGIGGGYDGYILINGLPVLTTADLPDLTAYATKSWVTAQGFLTSLPAHGHAWSELTGVPSTFTPSSHTHPLGQITGLPATYAPSLHNNSAHSETYITAAALSNYVTAGSSPTFNVVTFGGGGGPTLTGGQSYDLVCNSDFTCSILYASAVYSNGYSVATEDFVTSRGYLTSVPAGYATQTWVQQQGYLVTVPTDYATKTWVQTQGYLTSVSWTSVTGKPSTFTPSSHTHPMSEITSLPTSYPPSSHGDSAHSVTYAKQADLNSLANRVTAIEDYLGLN